MLCYVTFDTVSTRLILNLVVSNKEFNVYTTVLCGVKHIGIFIVILSLFVIPAQTQNDLDTIFSACGDMDRDTVCYGNAQVEIEQQPDSEAVEFGTVGDVMPAMSVQSITTSAQDESTDTWGLRWLTFKPICPRQRPTKM
jgi:hypothetical protein